MNQTFHELQSHPPYARRLGIPRLLSFQDCHAEA
jgi:hypothetical protein